MSKVPDSMVKNKEAGSEHANAQPAHPGRAGDLSAPEKEKLESKPVSKPEETAEDIVEYKEEHLAASEPPAVGDVQSARKTANDVDTLPPANEIKPHTTFSGKEKRKERRTNDLPSPMAFEEPEGVH